MKQARLTTSIMRLASIGIPIVGLLFAMQADNLRLAGATQVAVPARALVPAAKTPRAGSFFGWSVAISGSIALVGAPYKGSIRCGSAYEYKWPHRNETNKARLTVVFNPHCAARDRFGWSVGVSGKTFLVGAPGRDHNAGDVYTLSPAPARSRPSRDDHDGRLRLPAGKWPRPGDYYGRAVAVSGNIAVVGADGTANGNGAAAVFVRSGQSWRQKVRFYGTGGEQAGAAVAVARTTVVIGAPGNGTRPGVAYIVGSSNGAWRLEATLVDPAHSARDLFGSAVAISGDLVLVGASGTKTDGVVYAFQRAHSGWTNVHTLTAPITESHSSFGASVGISTTASGAWAVVGAPRSHRCRAFVFWHAGRSWRPDEVADPARYCTFDHFGASVAVSGNIAVIGAPGWHKNTGEGYLVIL